MDCCRTEALSWDGERLAAWETTRRAHVRGEGGRGSKDADWRWDGSNGEKCAAGHYMREFDGGEREMGGSNSRMSRPNNIFVKHFVNSSSFCFKDEKDRETRMPVGVRTTIT